jgi:PTS hybrid protein
LSSNVSIVIVSHSPDVARGAADMVRDMVGEQVRVAHCGGDGVGGLGTSVTDILRAIREVYSAQGVAILIDVGGAETNSEIAIEMLPEDMRGNIVICDAPVVEGALMAGIEAASGSSLDEVRACAEGARS